MTISSDGPIGHENFDPYGPDGTDDTEPTPEEDGGVDGGDDEANDEYEGYVGEEG